MLISLTGCCGKTTCYEKTTGYVEFNGKTFLSDSSGKVACTIDVSEGEKFVLICGTRFIKKDLSNSQSGGSVYIFYLVRSNNKIRVQSIVEYVGMKFEEESVFKFTLTDYHSKPSKNIDFEISIKDIQQDKINDGKTRK
jgi:hypothetical protein